MALVYKLLFTLWRLSRGVGCASGYPTCVATHSNGSITIHRNIHGHPGLPNVCDWVEVNQVDNKSERTQQKTNRKNTFHDSGVECSSCTRLFPFI
ncbi:hypothetical protein NPIL_408991 [Nephila pilipes]|uniref:Secreted protein n=1 Tax=Nephila pilipes TaxID=299642 RepID=A0A8X6UKM8_NEPPI|nr:hypothetical protein NPIL_408991 [Nephila pilipes]